MSLLTAQGARTTKSAHILPRSIALAGLPIAVLAAAAYGSVPLHAIANALRVAFRTVGFGAAQMSDAPLDIAFLAILGVIGAAVALGVREHRAEADRDLFDVR